MWSKKQTGRSRGGKAPSGGRRGGRGGGASGAGSNRYIYVHNNGLKHELISGGATFQPRCMYVLPCVDATFE